MSDHYAILDDDVITNVVVCDDPVHAEAQGWLPLAGQEPLPWIGWVWDGAQWNPPPPPPPAVTGMYPQGGTPGTVLTIGGLSLAGTTQVLLGTFTCPNLAVIDNETVACSTPAGPSKGQRPVTVTVDGEDIPAGDFFVT